MVETMKNATTEEINENVTIGDIENDVATEDLFREAVEPELKKVERLGLLMGAQTMCRMVLDKIVAFKTKPGKPTMNDYKRLVKDIQTFCETGISRKVNADGETEPVEETVVSETIQN